MSAWAIEFAAFYRGNGAVPKLLRQLGRPILARASVLEPNPSDVTSFTAQVAEVSVDAETGEVKLLKFTTAHDIGRVLNPLDHQGQIEGAVIQSIGYALTEGIEIQEEGGYLPPSFLSPMHRN